MNNFRPFCGSKIDIGNPNQVANKLLDVSRKYILKISSAFAAKKKRKKKSLKYVYTQGLFYQFYHLPYLKIFSNLVHFCPNFQIFCPLLPFFNIALPFFCKIVRMNLLSRKSAYTGIGSLANDIYVHQFC